MTKENEITPEYLLNKIGEVAKSFNILGMTNYLQVDPSLFNIWRRRKALPYRNVKKIIEYFEMHNDDVIDLCCDLMAYYKQEEKKRNDRIAETTERNRQKSRDRYRKNK